MGTSCPSFAETPYLCYYWSARQLLSNATQEPLYWVRLSSYWGSHHCSSYFGLVSIRNLGLAQIQDCRPPLTEFLTWLPPRAQLSSKNCGCASCCSPNSLSLKALSYRTQKLPTASSSKDSYLCLLLWPSFSASLFHWLWYVRCPFDWSDNATGSKLRVSEVGVIRGEMIIRRQGSLETPSLFRTSQLCPFPARCTASGSDFSRGYSVCNWWYRCRPYRLHRYPINLRTALPVCFFNLLHSHAQPPLRIVSTKIEVSTLKNYYILVCPLLFLLVVLEMWWYLACLLKWLLLLLILMMVHSETLSSISKWQLRIRLQCFSNM